MAGETGWFDSMLEAMGHAPGRSRWQPAADVYRTGDGWLIKFDLAGVQPDDLKLEVSGRRVTISGCRRDRLIEEGATHYQMEISYSSFEKSVELPGEVEKARLSTEMREGMLLVRLQISD